MTAEAATHHLDITPPLRKPRATKAAGAFLTIGELAEQMKIGQHVLRFWESKFRQIQPMKRAGSRRYYRPEDVQLLRRIQTLLYRDGYTIRGVQALLEGETPAVRAVNVVASPARQLPDHEASRRRLEAVTAVDATLAASGRMLYNPDDMPQLGAEISAADAIAAAQEVGDFIRIPRKDLQKLVSELLALRELLAEAEAEE